MVWKLLKIITKYTGTDLVQELMEFVFLQATKVYLCLQMGD